jgi:hypothetical protein
MLECYERISVKLQKMKFMKVRSAVFQLLHADRQIERHREVNRSIFAALHCERDKNSKKPIVTGIQLQFAL